MGMIVMEPIRTTSAADSGETPESWLTMPLLMAHETLLRRFERQRLDLECDGTGKDVRFMSTDGWQRLEHRLSPTDDAIDVVRLDLVADCDRITSLRALLSTDELARADRYVFDESRRRFIVCRGVLRQLLGGCLERKPASLEFHYGPYGKPMLGSADKESIGLPSLEFSVSHSVNWALIAVTRRRRVGVDIECHDNKTPIHELARRFFSAGEAAELASLAEPDQRAGFFRGWTSKEAYLKATGLGLSYSLNRFSVAMNPRLPAQLLEVADLPDPSDFWRMIALEPADHFSAALLVEAARHETVRVRQWSVEEQDIPSPSKHHTPDPD